MPHLTDIPPMTCEEVPAMIAMSWPRPPSKAPQVPTGGGLRSVGGGHLPADGGWPARLSRTCLGRRLRFADGTSSLVFRETAVRDRHPRDAAVLVV
jgi:hypothetical protein